MESNYGVPTGCVPRPLSKADTVKIVMRPPIPESSNDKLNPLRTQVSGDHYRYHKIQPIEYIHANNIPFAEGNIIKYVTRWRDKGGIKDLEKARHYIELLISLENKNND